MVLPAISIFLILQFPNLKLFQCLLISFLFCPYFTYFFFLIFSRFPKLVSLSFCFFSGFFQTNFILLYRYLFLQSKPQACLFFLFFHNDDLISCTKYLEQRFSTQITPRPVFEEKNFYDPQQLLRTFITCRPFYFQQKTLHMIVMPMTRLKSSTTRYRVATRRLRNADLEDSLHFAILASRYLAMVTLMPINE